MTTRRRRTSARASRGPRRAVRWIDTIVNLTNAGVGAQNVTSLLTNLRDQERKGATLLRMIIDLWLVAQTVGTGSLISLGTIQVTDDAVAAGSVPDPADTADEAAWRWRTHMPTFTAVLNEQQSTARVQVDLRGKMTLRAVDNDFILVTDSGASATDVNIDGIIRCLFRLT